MSVTLTSCGSDDDNNNESLRGDLVGSWELYKNTLGSIAQEDVIRLHLNSNGIGIYEDVNAKNETLSIISWKEYTGNYNRIFEIFFENGTSLKYYWEIKDNNLLLFDHRDPETCHYYRPIPSSEHELVKSWELYEDNDGIVSQLNKKKMHLNSTGVGIYETVDQYTKTWEKSVISWKEYNGNYNRILEIFFDNGNSSKYYWEIHNGKLQLYNCENPEIYQIYRVIY